ncbi:hypothetical protein OPT61_g9775 [Boeremia exigua]|uniref:Uncharacterized protein n=1 Tax=Boeremia exigua TaxID=749465 RepID=A0ACC2HTA9_9PLEO|nr:hypothetical protein OPT61_g9775 [Boeremia exigua]
MIRAACFKILAAQSSAAMGPLQQHQLFQPQLGFNDMVIELDFDDMPTALGSDDMPTNSGSDDMPTELGSDDMPTELGSNDMPTQPGFNMPMTLGFHDMHTQLSYDMPPQLSFDDRPMQLGSDDMPVQLGFYNMLTQFDLDDSPTLLSLDHMPPQFEFDNMPMLLGFDDMPMLLGFYDKPVAPDCINDSIDASANHSVDYDHRRHRSQSSEVLFDYFKDQSPISNIHNGIDNQSSEDFLSEFPLFHNDLAWPDDQYDQPTLYPQDLQIQPTLQQQLQDSCQVQSHAGQQALQEPPPTPFRACSTPLRILPQPTLLVPLQPLTAVALPLQLEVQPALALPAQPQQPLLLQGQTEHALQSQLLHTPVLPYPQGYLYPSQLALAQRFQPQHALQFKFPVQPPGDAPGVAQATQGQIFHNAPNHPQLPSGVQVLASPQEPVKRRTWRKRVRKTDETTDATTRQRLMPKSAHRELRPHAEH